MDSFCSHADSSQRRKPCGLLIEFRKAKLANILEREFCSEVLEEKKSMNTTLVGKKNASKVEGVSPSKNKFRRLQAEKCPALAAVFPSSPEKAVLHKAGKKSIISVK